MGIVNWYWNSVLGGILGFIFRLTGIAETAFFVIIGKVLLTLAFIWLLITLVSKLQRGIGKVFRKDRLVDSADVRALQNKDGGFTEQLEAVQNLGATIARLKKAGNYRRMGDVYASVNRHKDAAKWYRKAGDRDLEAMELAKAGKTLKAAKILMKIGDFKTAARMFTEVNRHNDAAKAYAKAGDNAKAAGAFGRAGNFGDAIRIYSEYFANPTEALEQQLAAADECLNTINSPEGKSKIPADSRSKLLPALANRFEQAKRFDQAAALYKESGELVRAGEVFVLAGKLQEAAECMKLAGKQKEASAIVGRYHQSRGNWKEAATAYAQAGDFMNAGECFARAADAVRAGECFEKAQKFFRAGVAYAHAARYEYAIRVLQKLPETDPDFEQSRALMGRCFYELHDYAHCAAALENHLTGKRVDTANVDYFYMLALAFEQLGKLDQSRELLYKIRTVNVQYKDVAQRISSISTRISLAGSATQYTPAPGSGVGAGGQPQSAVATQVMQTVESALGGRYVLEKELGRGGMGVVYLAKDSQLDRPVALKFLGNLVDNSEEFRERFVREARTAAKISHPNIIAIYDISASVGKAYIAMEYVDGPSLHKYLTGKGALKPREAINVIVQACNALAAIHEAGIVHRDIKPDNILIAKGGLVKLTDFGLAKSEDSRMTRTGVVMGTPSYMSPEQVLGKDADVRSDIYSMGLVLWECLTGETAFVGQDVLERQLKDLPTPPSAMKSEIPQELDVVVMKAIAKKPDERHATVKDLIAALRAVSLQ